MSAINQRATSPPSSATNTSTSSDQNQPGLVSAHIQYVKGATENLIGSVTGNESWTSSGEHDKQAAVEAMREASKNRDPATSGYGKVEEVAGRLTGCEGMEKEGRESEGRT